MKCARPVRLGKAPDIQIVPCGKCVHCRVQRTQEWAVRIYHEMQYHDASVFLTLTYDDRFLPISLSRYQLSKYFKRVRKHFPGRRIKYFACGEYGTNPSNPLPPEYSGMRAHYHAILFGVGLSDCETIPGKPPGLKLVGGPLFDAWQGRGYAYVGTVSYNSARYVAGYVQKKLYGSMALKYGQREPPFSATSNGIGKRWAFEFFDQLARDESVTVQGRSVGIPRYYLKQFDEYVEGEDFRLGLLQLQDEAREEREELLISRYGDVDDLWPAVIRENLQTEKNLEARSKLYG